MSSAVAAPVKVRVTCVAQKVTHGFTAVATGSSGGETVHRDVYTTSAAENMSPFYEVVWVRRVK
jgi:hypothetical protein